MEDKKEEKKVEEKVSNEKEGQDNNPTMGDNNEITTGDY